MAMCKTCGMFNTLEGPGCNCYKDPEYSRTPICTYCGERHSQLVICSDNPLFTMPSAVGYCSHCKGYHDPASTCLGGVEISTGTIDVAEIKQPYILEDLHDELGKLSWSNGSESWNEAVTSIRELIRDKIA